MKAHAVVAVEPGRVEFVDVNVPEPGPEDVVVRLVCSWISNGTEGSFIRGERIEGDTPRSASDPLPFPHVPGYQKVGVVEAVGSAVQDLAIGEMVFATVSRVEGMFYPTGGHVSPAVTHRSQIWKLPAGLEPKAASGLVLTQVGYNVGIRPTVAAGDAVAVIGDGMVGQWAAQTLRHRGARVLLLGKHDDRLARFPVSEQDRIVNITRENPLLAVREWAPEGLQAVADTIGPVAFVESLFPLMRWNSHISSAGFYGARGQIDIQKMRAREMTLHAPSGWSAERLSATMELLACGALTTLPLITHEFAASRAADAYQLILDRKAGVLGVVLNWEE